MKNERYYWFQIRCYFSDKDVLTNILSNDIYITHYAFALHDKDANGDGELIKPHTHIVVKLSNNCTLTAFIKRNLIENKYSPHYSVVDYPLGAFEYLTHLNNEDKYQYDSDIIVSNNINYFNSLSSERKIVDVEQILIDIHNKVSFIELARRYGRDLVLNYDKYLKYSQACFPEQNTEYDVLLAKLNKAKELQYEISQLTIQELINLDFYK